MTLDNGSEFAGRAMEAWAMQMGVQLCFIRPGRPVENGFIESFNGRLRDECLNVEWFTSLEKRAKSWRCGEITTTTSGRTAHWTIARPQCLPLCTEPEESASPCSTRIRQTANRVKGSLRRPTPPLTRPAVCPKIPVIRAKRSYASLRPGTLY